MADMQLAEDRTHSEARARRAVVKHLRKLLAGGTTAGMSLGLCSCVDPAVPPSTIMDCSHLDLACPLDAFAYVGERGPSVHVGLIRQYRNSNLKLAGPPALERATVKSCRWSATGADIEFTPDPGVKTIRVSVPLFCSGRPQNASLIVDLSGAASGMRALPVRYE